eukprot:GHRR01003479.1.p1 GENE.GHRR01003479.1~~GHRR01003479.1.p1  ORF type:complete len:349 (+),score=112.10 GHRR01003479.1:317-1363(+)
MAAQMQSTQCVHHHAAPIALRAHAKIHAQHVCRSGRPQFTHVTTAVPDSPSRPLQRHQLLQDPAQIGAKGSATATIKDMGGHISLDSYMRLPVEQYYILDPSQIQFLQDNRFVLSVPRINLLGAGLQPIIEVEVRSEQDAIVLQAIDCKLNATGIMGGLDSKFAMQWTTRLTWSSQQPQQHEQMQHQQWQQHATQGEQQQQQQQQAQVASNGNRGPLSNLGNKLGNSLNRLKNINPSGNGSNSTSSSSASEPPSTPGTITGSAVVQVWCKVVPPFHLMPRQVLESSCNSVLSGLVNSLLPWFMKQLAADYQKWAADAEYRAVRRARTEQKNAAQRAQAAAAAEYVTAR